MSSGSESDEDYVPGAPEQLSEEESADEETEKQYENEIDIKTKKRCASQSNIGKKKLKKTRSSVKEAVTEKEEEKTDGSDETVDPEEEKKREEDLWAKFLEGTDTKPKAVAKQTNASSEPTKSLANEDIQKANTKQNDDAHEKERRIFEFAGETIIVENNVIKEKIKSDEICATDMKLDGPSTNRPTGKASGKPGGLSNILGQLNKKNKLTTLEKSKLDWTTYKKEEGIEEEIQSHNKGKQGYLDRRDFLDRADVRQYEIERELRMSRRSNR